MQEETEIVECYREGTLGALLSVYELGSDIEIFNECGEQLMEYRRSRNLLPMRKLIVSDLKARRVIEIDAVGTDVIRIYLEGVEDAE